MIISSEQPQGSVTGIKFENNWLYRLILTGADHSVNRDGSIEMAGPWSNTHPINSANDYMDRFDFQPWYYPQIPEKKPKNSIRQTKIQAVSTTAWNLACVSANVTSAPKFAAHRPHNILLCCRALATATLKNYTSGQTNMAVGKTLWTYFDNTWEAGNTPILGAADHATWLGTLVFDGARKFEGVSPDLEAHCERANQSALAMGLQPGISAANMTEIAQEGLKNFPAEAAVYIRPMYWPRDSGPSVVAGDPESTEFCMCLEEVPMPAPDAGMTLTTTQFCRPTLAMALVNAKAACLYPHNARMLREANSKGFKNAIVCDSLGNVAETATSNIMMVRDGEIFTPAPNGTFLNGITRQRVTSLLEADGRKVQETTLSLDDFAEADEIFTTGNIAKITPVTQLAERKFQPGPIAKLSRELYWDWALSR